MKSYYQILGVNPNISDKDLQKKVQQILRDNHPDLNPGDKEKEEFYKEVSHMYSILSNPKRRQEYDAKLKGFSTSQAANVYGTNFSGSQNSNNKSRDRKMEIIQKLNKLQQEIDKIDIDISVIKRSISNRASDGYNNKLEGIDIDEKKAISDIEQELITEKNKRRFISTFFSSVDKKLVDEYNDKKQNLRSEYSKKREELEQEWKERLEEEEKENKEKQSKIDSLMSSKSSLQEQYENCRQILYPNNTASDNLHKSK